MSDLKKPFQPSKFGKPLGFNSFSGKNVATKPSVKGPGAKFNPTLFKGPQHKG